MNVPLWFIIISLLFLYLSKLLFSGFRQLKVILYAKTLNATTELLSCVLQWNTL